MGAPFSAEARQVDTVSAVLTLRGRLDAGAEPPLSDAHNQTRNRSTAVVAVDCTGLDFVDGSGLGLLVKLWSWTRTEGQAVRLFGLGERWEALLRELGLHDALPLFPGEREALAGGPRGPTAPSPGSGDVFRAVGWAVALGRARPGHPAQGFSQANVEGRRVQGPLQGFGQLWHKTYRTRLSGVTVSPGEVGRVFREHLGELWPEGNQLYLPPPGVVPGAVGAIHLRMPGGVPLDTGVRVLHADAASFTLATLEGHLQAGWITFGAYDTGDCTAAQVQSLGRTGDPLYELGFRLFGHAQQEHFWGATLAALGSRLGVAVRVEAVKDLLDPGLNWAAAPNLWRNAGLRTGLQAAAAGVGRLLSAGRR
ncbi:MAG: STAS domain-containing protein [Deferrisomatales bacterium]|nr:STAS domain-containing protein [Deferrisomatales bacterium]